MKYRPLYKVLISIVVIYGFCFASCERCDMECNPKVLGEVFLQDSSLQLIRFRDQGQISMVNSNGAEYDFTYSDVEVSKLMLGANCVPFCDDDVCCDHFLAEQRKFSLEADLLSLKFDFSLHVTGDFDFFDAVDTSATFTDVLLVDFRPSRLSVSPTKDSLPNSSTIFLDSLQIIDRVFYDVYTNHVWGRDTSSSLPLFSYFTKKLGIVGFELHNGQKWELK